MVDQNVNLNISFGSPLEIVLASEPGPSISSVLEITYRGFTIIVEGDYIVYTLPADHEVKMQVAYVDAGGNPAKVDGDVQWMSSDESLATVAVDPSDSTIVTVTPVGPVGQVQVTARADADLGAGVKALVTTSDITIEAGEAVTGTISPVGAPTPKA
jgi:hypothetical protein